MNDWGYHPSRPSEQAVEDDPSQPAGLGGTIRRGASRVLLGLAGAGLLAGFFLPWLVLGDVVSVSGFTLLISPGSAGKAVPGPHSLMLLAVPVVGALLLAGAVTNNRFTARFGLVAGGCGVVYGLFILLQLFFRTTGSGMWFVIASGLLAFSVGLVSVARR